MIAIVAAVVVSVATSIIANETAKKEQDLLGKTAEEIEEIKRKLAYESNIVRYFEAGDSKKNATLILLALVFTALILIVIYQPKKNKK